MILTGVLVALTIAEVTLRLIGFGVVTPQMSFGMHARTALDTGYFVPDATLFWKVSRGANARSGRAANFVHPDQLLPPPGVRKRLLVLGDSCSRVTVNGPPYSAHLQAALGRAEWEVLNASVPGYSSYQGLIWLRSQLLDAEPDVVVVFYGWNDHWRTTGMTDREYERSIKPTYVRLLTLFKGRADPPPFRVSLDEYRENLQSIIDEVGAGGGRVILIANPYGFTPEILERYIEDNYLVAGDSAEDLHRAYLDVVREFAGGDGVTVLGADVIFPALGRATPLLRRDGIHFTDAGHRAMGALLAELIRSGRGGDGTAAPALLAAARRAL